MSKVYTIGETTYDILFRNGQPKRAIVGGSILNTTVSLGRLGLAVSFISRMGYDKIGELSLQFLIDNRVACDFVSRFEGNSRLALAFLDDENNAEYQFYKSGKTPSLQFPELDKSDVIIFGSANALSDESRDNLLSFLQCAHEKNVLTIYDPNIREPDPLKLVGLRKKFEENLFFTKMLKGSDQDFYRLYQTNNADVIFEKVAAFGVEVLIVTYGSRSVELRTKVLSLTIPVVAVEPVSTIGAGDNFTAGLVFGLLRGKLTISQIRQFSAEEWKTIIELANQFAKEVCLSEFNYISNEFAEQFV